VRGKRKHAAIHDDDDGESESSTSCKDVKVMVDDKQYHEGIRSAQLKLDNDNAAMENTDISSSEENEDGEEEDDNSKTELARDEKVDESEDSSSSDDNDDGGEEDDQSKTEVVSDKKVDEDEVDEINDIEEGDEEEVNEIKEEVKDEIKEDQESNENPDEANDKNDEASVSSNDDSSNMDETEDGGDVTKVRVRVVQRLEDGFCQAILPLEFRDKWGDMTRMDDAKPAAMEVDKTPTPNSSDDEVDQDTKPTTATTNTAAKNEPPQPPQPVLDFEVMATPQKKPNGSTKCKAVGCPKISQSHSEGFCRAHHNRFLICTGQCDSWDCVCGEKIASFQARCGSCHRWRDGKHAMSASKARAVVVAEEARSAAVVAEEARSAAAVAGDDGSTLLDGLSNDLTAAAADAPLDNSSSQNGRASRTYVPPDSGCQISPVPRTNDKGRSLCKVIDCTKMDQSNNEGFCRMHFNMFTIVAEVDNWTCVCGMLISGAQKRCGKCNKWRGGKRDPYAVSKRQGISEDNIIYGDDGTEIWRCECGNEVPSTKARCGRCHHWRGGRRQGGWKLGNAMGRDYESDDGIDRTQDWKCCGTSISSRQTRCGKCNGWRGGKRIASKGLPVSQVADNRPPWECVKCRISNPGATRKCGGCQTWKGTGKSNGSGKSSGKGGGRTSFLDDDGGLVEGNTNLNWQCKKCNFDNFETEIACFICQATRPNWQWHKKQQLISTSTTAPGAAALAQYPVQAPTTSMQPTASAGGTLHAPTSTQYATNRLPATAGSIPVSTQATGTQIATTNPATAMHAVASATSQGAAVAASAQTHDSHASAIDNSAIQMNYYGTYNDSMSYPLISIHYDFNQAYYSNHDYSYLNSGISGSSSSPIDGNNKDSSSIL